MYIEDQKWDKLINEACEMADYLGNLRKNAERDGIPKFIGKLEDAWGLLYSFINLENKASPLSNCNQLIESRWEIFKWAMKKIFCRKKNR